MGALVSVNMAWWGKHQKLVFAANKLLHWKNNSLTLVTFR
jgi:hypothetical protein